MMVSLYRSNEKRAKDSIEFADLVGRMVYIWSNQHLAYWRAGGAGYTVTPYEVGIFSWEDAYTTTEHCGPEKEIFYELVPEPAPIPMIIFCPACGVQHVDAANPNWDNPPHKTHRCEACHHLWRPAGVPTEGVADLPLGSSDTRPAIRLRAHHAD